MLKAKKGPEIDIKSAGCGAARETVLACSALDSIIPFLSLTGSSTKFVHIEGDWN